MAKKRIHSKPSLGNVDVGKVFKDKDKDKDAASTTIFHFSQDNDAALTTTFMKEEIIPLTMGTTI